jgi:hypothetical protein
MQKILTGLLLCFACITCHAQIQENQGWFFLTHQQKLSTKFDLLADAQLRTADKYSYLNTLLLRTGLSYNLNKKHSVALGYVYKGDWEHEDTGTAYALENRIFEQYLYNFKIGRTEMNARARLEQRWVHEESTNFSQRARAFISAQIPLIADTGFTKGLFAGIQNELFINVQHKQHVNRSTFDQNRTYATIGYRWSKKIDTEFGYMYWFQKEMDDSYRRHILQLTVSTSF